MSVSLDKQQPYLIPFRKNTLGMEISGSVPSSISRYEMRKKNWQNNYEWKENKPFDACLRFVDIFEGGKTLWREQGTEIPYWMSASSLATVLKRKSMIIGTVLAKWKFKKHGNSYTIVLVS